VGLDVPVRRTDVAPASGRFQLGAPTLVVAATVVAFLPALSGGFLNWDDVAFLVQNPHWRGLSREHLAWMFTTVEAGHYQPLAWLSLALDHRWWGMDPLGYHLTNLLLHAINAALLYAVIRALEGGAAATDRAAAALGASFFALHPLRVESVAWITERRELLSAALLLLAFLVYLRAARAPRRRAWLHGAALVLLAASLLAEAWGMTFALVLLVVDVWVLGRRVTREVLLEKLPYIVLGVAAAAGAALAQRSAGATLGLVDHGLGERVLQAGYGICFYVVKTLAPIHLSPLYLMEEQRSLWEVPRYLLATLAAAGVTASVVLARRRLPSLFAAWVCYLIVVSPVLGLVQSGAQLVADRYTYVACMPWAVLLGAAIAAGLRAVPARSWPAVAGVGGALVVLGGLGVLTARQAVCWKDTLSLWDQAVRAQPENYVARANRGNARLAIAMRRTSGAPLDATSRGLLRAAIDDYDRSIVLAPGFGYAHASRGLAYLILGDDEAALRDLDAAVRLVGPDPDVLAQRARAAKALAGRSQRSE
jgi:tetratricopeptide (TPR) repeat protein